MATVPLRLDPFATIAGVPPAPPAANRPPAIAAIADVTAVPGQAVSIRLQVSDPDGDAVTLSLAPGTPAGAAIDPATGVLTWTVPSS